LLILEVVLMVDVDIDLLVKVLRQHGHTVEEVISVPENAGVFELKIDGEMLNLEEARDLLE
jgi:predicted Rdx family selenoprotein